VFEKKISIGTFNINGGLKVDFKNDNIGLEKTTDLYTVKNDTSELCELLSNIAPDIFCMQEVHFSSFDQAEFIAEKLGYPYYYAQPFSPDHHFDGANMGLGIFSRYLITAREKINFYSPKANLLPEGWTVHQKGMLVVDIKTPFGLFSVGTLHILPVHRFPQGSFTPEELNKYTRNIDKNISSLISKYNPTFLMGDFNNNPDKVEEFFPQLFNFSSRVPFGPNHTKQREFSQLYFNNKLNLNSFMVNNLQYSDHEPSVAFFSK